MQGTKKRIVSSPNQHAGLSVENELQRRIELKHQLIQLTLQDIEALQRAIYEHREKGGERNDD